MKKLVGLIGLILIFLAISVSGSAQAEKVGVETPLTAYMGTNYDLAEKVSFSINGADYDIDKDNFFEIADAIIIKNIKNTILKRAGKDDWNENMLYIYVVQNSSVETKNAKQSASVNISEFGEVSDYRSSGSSFPDVDYEMKQEDLLKLYSLLPEDAQENLEVNDFGSSAGEYKPFLDTDLILVCIMICLFVLIIVLTRLLLRKIE